MKRYVREFCNELKKRAHKHEAEVFERICRNCERGLITNYEAVKCMVEAEEEFIEISWKIEQSTKDYNERHNTAC